MQPNKIYGIIAAMKIEAEGLIAEMTEVQSEKVSGIVFTRGKLRGATCVVAVCGIGKVFAALCAQTMILRYHPTLIINTGVAGSLTDGIGVYDIVIAEGVVQHDMDTSALGDPVGYLSGIDRVVLPCSKATAEGLLLSAEKATPSRCHKGVIATGDRFVYRAEDKATIVSSFGALACEMEGGAVAQVCYVNGVDCAIVRAISDSNGAVDYTVFAAEAASRSVSTLLCFLEAEGA
jgi:adenosylhomocysteine nucleosidase